MCTAQIVARRARRCSALLAAVFFGGAGMLVTAQAAPRGEAVIVKVDHAKIVRLPAKAQTVIVGNPAIADVSVQRNGVMIVTGKSYGVTNLIALDAAGTLLAESQLSVGAADEAVVTVQRGMERESYSCTPQCQPSMQIGDAQDYFGKTLGQAQARNNAALNLR